MRLRAVPCLSSSFAITWLSTPIRLFRCKRGYSRQAVAAQRIGLVARGSPAGPGWPAASHSRPALLGPGRPALTANSRRLLAAEQAAHVQLKGAGADGPFTGLAQLKRTGRSLYSVAHERKTKA